MLGETMNRAGTIELKGFRGSWTVGTDGMAGGPAQEYFSGAGGLVGHRSLGPHNKQSRAVGGRPGDR